MTRKNLVHTGPGIELVRSLASEANRVFTMARARELAPAVGLSAGYLRQALHYLAKSGWVVRLRKGLYALSSTVPGVTPAHEFEIAMALVEPAAISHWSALHYHGLTEQTPRKVFVLTTTEASVPRMRGAKARLDRQGFLVGDTIYRFVQVKPERFFGTERVWIGEARVTITDPERTLLDGLTMPQHCGDFAEVLHAFQVRGTHLNLERIIEYALKLGAATAKRLGWVLEHQGIDSSELEQLAAVPIKGYRKLDPTGPRKGPCNRRWMIQENLPGKVNA
ncbi:MAG: type IV toxin-antitoxin system AbiEi family antitoxin domain-containing protein [Bryobacteraceae bacterium]|nr:type IV toxin-antitoxin system AbiEi family antitoxin domain-containing protein [Bryobacteraceae bacterium]